MRTEQRGPQLFLTRTRPEFLIELFKLEVPEVGQGLIQILGAARDAGVRAKIAVTQQRQPHRSGRCVRRHARLARAGGIERARRRARRHHSYDENPAQFVINAMAPAEVLSIVVDEDSHYHGYRGRRRRSCRRPSAAAVRTSASRASSRAGN